ncbi:SDR family NAD(P)-dependent oxidoreductase [Sorangium sp. So ce887]|uniref:SDR family NAD(P)-dependent oxidoreductase n=1 Tax=Sorangium sp. So ce887 TaxID=3133324 RepID=UPI003F60E0F7
MQNGREAKTFIQAIKNANFIVRDHLVHGVRILPGVALLDMIYRLAGAYLSTQAIELENVLFKQPISTSEDFDQDVYVTFAPRGAKWSVSIASQKVKGGAQVEAKKADILECSLAPRASGAPGRKVDVQALVREPDRRWDLDEFYRVAREGRIEHFDFMKTLGTVYQRGQEELMEIRLSALAEKYRGNFHAHPALLDASTLAGSSFLLSGDLHGGAGQGTPFIPFLIQRFCIHRPLPQTVYTYSTRPRRPGDDGVTHDDLFSTDITICDERGEVLVEFQKLTIKRVRESKLITQLASSARGASLQASGHAAPPAGHAAPPAGHAAPPAEHALVSSLQAKIADMLGGSPAAVGLQTGFYELGLDSTQLLGLARWLEQEVGAELYPTLLFEYATIRRLTEYLLEHHPRAFARDDEAAPAGTPEVPEIRQAIVGYLQEQVARVLERQPEGIGDRTGFYDLGLDSTQLLHLVGVLEKRVGEALYPTLLFEYATVERLADYLVEKHAAAFRGRARPLAARAGGPDSLVESTGSLMMFQPVWVDEPSVEASRTARRPDHRVVVLHGSAAAHEARIREALRDAEVIRLDSAGPSVAARFEASFQQLFRRVQAWLKERSGAELLVQIVADSGEEGRYAHALGALLKTAHQENPSVHGQVIGVEGIDRHPEEVVRLLGREGSSREPGCSEVQYLGDRLRRRVLKWRRSVPAGAPAGPVYRDGGVYLIAGGLGGLGYLLADHLLRRARARVALIGRSQAEPWKIDGLSRPGADVFHVRADLGNEAELQRAVQAIRERMGPVNGVLHLAGLLKDQVIVQKDPSEIVDVFRPKVRGLENLDKVTRDEPLDFFVTFSSLSAAFGSLGQCDYASANAFMDCFIEHRRQLVRGGARSGKSLSIDWPLWREGGMQIHRELERMMLQSSGMKALPAEEGLRALDEIVQRDDARTLVVYGDERKVEERFGSLLAAPAAQDERANRFASEPRDIAVVGVSGRYPMASSIAEFYENLRDGRDCTSGMPKERWEGHSIPYDVEQFYRFGGFIDRIDGFDPLFFNIPPRQAEVMDPQARLFLQAAWEACEDAGFYLDRTEHHYPVSARKSVGVFAGVFWSHYELFAAEQTQRGTPMSFGVTPAAIPNTVSYCMNLHGPSMAVDSMCSSSLTSIHLACESIRRGECEYALAGGVNLVTHPHKYMFLSRVGFLSSDGKCRSFGAGGDGYVPGEGVGAVLLTTVEEAERQGYPIYGIIKGSALNHVGKTSGLTVPDPVAQGQVIAHALKNAGIDPTTMSYVEAHGTGTSLGDPIEIQGLNRAFRQSTDRTRFCAVGSAKSNIGHLEAAAGIAGLTKVLLQLQHGQLFPSLHGTPRNPFIPFESTAFYVVDRLQEWERPVLVEDGKPVVYPRRAGLSSFGASGSNAHVVLEEYIPGAACVSEPAVLSLAVVPLSARTRERLTAYARKLHRFLGERRVDLTELAYTYQVGREPFEHRVAFLVRTQEELLQRLSAFVNGEKEIRDCFTSEEKGSAQAAPVRGPDAARIARRWADGEAVNWSELYGEQRPRRISLPTYPFAEERYWVPQDGAQKLPAPAVTAELEAAIFVKEWKPEPAGDPSRPASGVVLVLQTPATASLAAALLEHVDGVEAFHAVQGDTDFYSAEAGVVLHERVKSGLAGRALLGVIDLTAYDVEYERSLDLEAGKIALLQRLIEHDRAAGLTLLQVTHNLTDCQTQAPTMQGARVSGLYRMLGAEYRQVRSICVDSDAPLGQREVLVEQILSEFFDVGRDSASAGPSNVGRDSASDPTGPSEVCYRNGRRHVPELVLKRTNEHIRRTAAAPHRYSPDDVILITGGTRGIGAAVAEHAVAQGCRHLVLMGREVLPSIPEWRGLIARPDRTEQREKLARLQRLIEQGCDVRYFSTPLTDAGGLQEMVKDIHRQAGPIRGVFHCAGVMGRTPVFFQKETSELQAVCEPKVRGLATLAQALQEEPLSFFILFSSVSGLAPTLATGQSDYAMANAFMDAFAAHHAGQGRSCFKSLQWPAWGEVGMAAGEGSTPTYARSGLAAVGTADGLRLLDIVMASEHAVSFPCVRRPGAFSAEALLRAKPARPAQESGKPALRAAARGGGREAIRAWLRDVFMSELKLTDAQMQDDKPFDEYGIDSILIAQLVKVLQTKVEQKLDPALLLEHGSLTALTDYFAEHHALSVHHVSSPAHAGLASGAAAAPAREAAAASDDIAVVGISCRFPAAPTKEAFWALLVDGRSAIGPVSGRWAPRRGRIDYGGWLDDYDMFDPGFFRLNEADAAVMDPQARVILEESLKAAYDAGYDHKELSGARVGVYIGARPQNQADLQAVLDAPNPVLAISPNYLASNVSRFFNLRGPSLVVDTACSSALTGMSFAVDSLKAGRIEMALVGAVSLTLTPFSHDLFDARNILSRDGRFELFDKRSGGEVLGEGAGIVVLKRLGDAVRDGNQIYGVLKAIASNNDGRTLGPGSPNIEAQRQVLKEALDLAGKRAPEIGYIEVNGGGSPVLDSIEIKALSDVYQLGNTAMPACAVGSIKPNVGHLLLASGLAGFIRCVLSVHYKQIPPFLSAKDPFDHYDFASSRIRFNREAIAWDVAPGTERVAAQSSFPDGGTNCHVVIGEFVAGGAYQQRYFPKPAPSLARRRFPPRAGSAPEPVAATQTVAATRTLAPELVAATQTFWGEVVVAS